MKLRHFTITHMLMKSYAVSGKIFVLFFQPGNTGIDTEDIDNQMAMIVGLTEAATAGDASAANVIVKLLGEDKPQSDSDFEDVADIRREVFGDE